MGKGQVGVRDFPFPRRGSERTVKRQTRFPARGSQHFQVRPLPTPRKPVGERFHGGFLGGKPSGQGGVRIFFLEAIFHFRFRENPFEKTVAMAAMRFPNAIDLDDIHTRADDHLFALSPIPRIEAVFYIASPTGKTGFHAQTDFQGFEGR